MGRTTGPGARSTASQPSRRALMIGAAAATAFPHCGHAADEPEVVEIDEALVVAARKEGRLLVRYSAPLDEMQLMADGFGKRFGITVQLDRKVGVLGTQQFATESRAGQHVMDVNYSADPPGIERLAKEGHYLRWTLKDLDDKLDPGAVLPGLGYCPKWTDIVIGYNPDLIPHADAKQRFKTWHGLLAPDLKGRIGINEPAGGGVPFALYLMFYRRPEYGREFMVRLAAQQPRLYPGSAPGREDLAAGAIAVFVPSWESIAMLQFLKGDKTAWTYPEIAPVFANTYLAIAKKAPHPAAARLFSAWFSTPEGARVKQLAQARPTLKGLPEARSAIPKLKETSWWTPFPAETRWIPDQQDWDTSYAKLMPDMRAVLGWRG